MTLARLLDTTPHSGLAKLISRISLRISGGTVGRPPRRLDFQRQNDLKPTRCHSMTVSGFKIARAFRIVGANRYNPAKIKRSMALKEPLGQMPVLYVNLMPKD
jgi:hypothetical protein